jgi:hypothetical protein
MIVVGDASPIKLAKTRMAKSVLDTGWGLLKNDAGIQMRSRRYRFQGRG